MFPQTQGANKGAIASAALSVWALSAGAVARLFDHDGDPVGETICGIS